MPGFPLYWCARFCLPPGPSTTDAPVLCLAASGTAGYRAPELTNGIEANYKACDVYSLGRTMLHLLTFSKPNPGTSTEHELELLRVHACLPCMPGCVVAE